MLIIVSLFKTRVGVSNDSVALHNFSELVQRGDILQKLSVIARFLKEQFFHENLWVYAWFYIMLTCIFFCKRIPTQTRLACLLVLLAAGYTTVYLLSPLELERNLATSIDRVLLHVFPLSVFFVFLLKEDGASGPKMLSFLK